MLELQPTLDSKLDNTWQCTKGNKLISKQIKIDSWSTVILIDKMKNNSVNLTSRRDVITTPEVKLRT